MYELIVHLAGADVDTEGVGWLLVLGPAGAVTFYTSMWLYYRNTDKSNQFERETRVEISNPTGSDRQVGTNNGTRARWISGRNDNSPRDRVQRVPGTEA